MLDNDHSECEGSDQHNDRSHSQPAIVIIHSKHESLQEHELVVIILYSVHCYIELEVVAMAMEVSFKGSNKLLTCNMIQVYKVRDA